MDKIANALATTDELIAIRKAALEKALVATSRKPSSDAKSNRVAEHKSALKALRRARRLLVAYRKKQK